MPEKFHFILFIIYVPQKMPKHFTLAAEQYNVLGLLYGKPTDMKCKHEVSDRETQWKVTERSQKERDAWECMKWEKILGAVPMY